MSEKINVLRNLEIGARVAEEEKEHLAAYFVETDQWRRIYAGDIDIIYGPKGSGKSAIYTVLLSRESDLFDRGVLLVSGENPTGTPAFQDLVTDPPTTEDEFVGLWKLYVLSLLGSVIEEHGIKNDAASELLGLLHDAKLLPPPRTLRARVKAVLEYVRALGRLEAVETGVKLDPVTGAPVGLTGKLVFGEPTADLAARGITSIDGALGLANEATNQAGLTVWLLFDRLDVAFAGSPDLEANALRALFRVYLDTVPLQSVVLKIFLRSDIWLSITSGGFREASHITRNVTISWNRDTLLNLVLRRLTRSQVFNDFYSIDAQVVLASADQQGRLLQRIFPRQVDSGRNPSTFDWMLGRVRDGLGESAPRELIHLLAAARDAQLRILERGGADPPDEQIIDRQALRDSLPEVSKVRLEQTLYAEYPELKARLEALIGEKTEQYPYTLASLWKVNEAEARVIADRLAEVGFFETRGSKESPSYWVPFLYRPALQMVQGAAEGRRQVIFRADRPNGGDHVPPHPPLE